MLNAMKLYICTVSLLSTCYERARESVSGTNDSSTATRALTSGSCPGVEQNATKWMPNMAGLVRTPPYEPILMNQDDSKQCEHLLSQENDPSYYSHILLYQVSTQSRYDLGHIGPTTDRPRIDLGAAERNGS